MLHRLFTVAIGLAVNAGVWAADPPKAVTEWQAAVTTATAAAYCMAKHPYWTLASEVTADGYTRDGYQVVGAPGVVGATRRNFVYDRSTDGSDEGQKQTCDQACAQMGKLYGKSMIGQALKQKVSDGSVLINSGLGDLGVGVMRDLDFYMAPPKLVAAAVLSRANTWQDADVAQADYCCCQVVMQ